MPFLKVIIQFKMFYLECIEASIESILFVQQQLDRGQIPTKVCRLNMMFLVANPTLYDIAFPHELHVGIIVAEFLQSFYGQFFDQDQMLLQLFQAS